MPESPNILVIVSDWPSKNHPYLVWLFGLLKVDFPGLRILSFNKPNRQYGYDLIGKEKTDKVLDQYLQRQSFTRNPFIHLKVLMTILLNASQSTAIVKETKKNGLSAAQIYGQFLYYHYLLGKRFDLVHMNALQTAYHFKAKAWFGNAKVIISSRGQDIDFFPDKYDGALSRADHIHVLGTYLKEKVMQKGIPETAITIIPPAYIPDHTLSVQPKKLPDGTIHMATAARLYWTKGFRYAIESIRLLVEDGIPVHYHIYGDGEQKEELDYIVRQYQLTDHITFHGWVDEPALKKELQQYDLYLLLSTEEAYNNSVIMAQSLGLPCIVTATGGLPENVTHMQTGIVVPSYNSKMVAQAIRELLTNPDRYTFMSSNAIEKVKTLSIDFQVKAYRDLYLKQLPE